MPSHQVGDFRELADTHSVTLKGYDTPKDPAQWHIAHQAQKCRADVWCPDADFVLHTDSDCIFTDHVTPEDYIIAGKPVMLMEDYANLTGNPWKPVVEHALKLPVRYEFMRRHPQVNPVGVYADLRAHVAQVQGMDFYKFVLSCKPDFPWGFTEHNTIGAFAYEDLRWKYHYHWINLANNDRPKDKLHQFWSHWGVEGTITDAGPYFGKRPIDIIKQSLQLLPA